MEYVKKRFLKYSLGSGLVRAHIDAVHAASPREDKKTGEIAEEIARLTGCGCIIATVSRTVADLNRPPNNSNRDAVQEYRSAIREILMHCGILDEETGKLTAPYLHLSVHGMKDTNYGEHAVEIGTRLGRSCSSEARMWFKKRVSSLAAELLPAETLFIMDRKFIGDQSLCFHRCGDGESYKGYDQYYNAFQIEISNTLRENYMEGLVKLLSSLVQEFNNTFKS
ncbi:MAG: Uncharacterized protein XD50_0667 [Clostridia bacterium 41_269]|nr:MAG: Uncharacterized protein XD50_0667 [Clostridia bacterium 41_269]